MQLIIVLMMTLVAAGVEAAPAVRLTISDCAPAPPPILACPANIQIYQTGQPVAFWVSATDATGQRATNYAGTIVFSSSNTSAVLPAPHTFTTADNSVFPTAVTFTTPSSVAGFINGTNQQEVMAADAPNGLSGTTTFLVLGAAFSPVPTLNFFALMVLVTILAFGGLVLSAERRLAAMRRRAGSLER